MLLLREGEERPVLRAVRKPLLALRRATRSLNNQLEDAIALASQKHIQSASINQKEVRIVGLRRCGNHAISTWIKEQEDGDSYTINNVNANENPYRYKYQNLMEYFPQYKWSIERFKKEAKRDFTFKKLLLYSYEDYSPYQVFTDFFESRHDLYLGKTQKRYDLLIIRDPFNWLASRLQKKMLSVKNINRNLIEIWIEYAKEFLGETSYMKQPKICVNYNLWTGEVDYRKQLASQLELEFSDSGIEKVHGCGGGSSFDGREFHGKATEMEVSSRWKKFVDNPSYRKLINNEELIDYSERIFGRIPGTEVLLGRSTTMNS